MWDLSETELLRSKRVTTRKEHWCPICQEAIPAGSKAWFETRIGEGKIFNVWFHPECTEES